MLEAFKGLLNSKKFWTAILSLLGVSTAGLENAPLPLLICLTLICLFLLAAQGLTDHGKAAAAIKAAPVTLKPGDTLEAVPAAAGPVVTGPERIAVVSPTEETTPTPRGES